MRKIQCIVRLVSLTFTKKHLRNCWKVIILITRENFMALLFEEVGMNGMNATDKIPAFKVV